MDSLIDIKEKILDLFQDLDLTYDFRGVFSYTRNNKTEFDLVIQNENNFGISKILEDIYPYILRCHQMSDILFTRGTIMTDQIQSLEFNIDIFNDFKSFELNDGKNRYSKKRFDREFTINTYTLIFEAE